MRVVHVIDALGVGGGAEHSLARLLPELRERGVQSHVICLFPRSGGLQRSLDDAGFPVEVLPAGWPRRLVTLRRRLQVLRPDVVHPSLSLATWLTRLANGNRVAPQVDSIVNTSYDPVRIAQAGVPPWKLARMRAVDGITARHLGGHFHVLTEAVKADVQIHLGIPESRISVIPRGLDPSQLGRRSSVRRDSVRQGLDIGRDAPVLIAVGRQDAQKAQHLAVSALGLVQRSRPDAVLLLAGREGDASRQIERARKALPRPESVRVLGPRTDVADLVAASDVFLFPSLYEGLGCALLEAMAIGTPIVTSDAAALVEVLDGGRCGLVARRGDVTSLAAAVSALLDDEIRARELSLSAQRRFHEHFHIDVVCDATVEMYQRIADRG